MTVGTASLNSSLPIGSVPRKVFSSPAAVFALTAVFSLPDESVSIEFRAALIFITVFMTAAPAAAKASFLFVYIRLPVLRMRCFCGQTRFRRTARLIISLIPLPYNA
jgi:hypothetical protein